MTFLTRLVQGLRDALESSPGFPAIVEPSPVRAMTRKDTQTVCVLPGAEAVDAMPIGRSTRARQVHVVVHTAGDDHLELSEAVFAAAHPVLMAFEMDNLVSVEEVGTDEPKYANGDLTRQVVTRRYRVVYQTDEHSLG